MKLRSIDLRILGVILNPIHQRRPLTINRILHAIDYCVSRSTVYNVLCHLIECELVTWDRKNRHAARNAGTIRAACRVRISLLVRK